MQQSQSLASRTVPVVQPYLGSVTVMIDGANASGKTTRAELMSEWTSFDFFDTGKKLREMKQAGLLPDDVIRCMSECGYVPDTFISRLLRDRAYHEPKKSKIYVGVRTVEQMHDLFLNACNFQHRVIHVRLHRKKEECMKLAELRGREDADIEGFNVRWGLYQQHAASIQSFLNSRPAIRQISFRLTDDIQDDSRSILELIQPYCPSISLPELVTAQ